MNFKENKDWILYNNWLKSLEKGSWLFNGISLGNPFYTNSETLSSLFCLLDENNIKPKITFFEESHLHTLISLWNKNPIKERDKRLRYHKNKLLKALLKNESYNNVEILKEIKNTWYIDSSDDKNWLVVIDEQFKNEIFINWNDEVTHNFCYKSILADIKNLYKDNLIFKRDVEIEYHSSINRKDGKVWTWIEYLFEEFAFLLSSYEILWTSIWTLMYHKEREILERLVNWEYGVDFENTWMLIFQ